jgi:hypothetical protein
MVNQTEGEEKKKKKGHRSKVSPANRNTSLRWEERRRRREK